MNSSSPTHLAFPTRRWSAALALSLTLMLAACATGATPDEKTPAPSADMSTATLLLAGESITFELQFCSIDDTDSVAHGPGVSDVSGEPSYLSVEFAREGSVSTGEARVDLGATTQFQSMDDFYVFTTAYLPGEYSFTVDGDSLVLEAEFRHANGSPAGVGTLTVDCQ